MTTKALMQRHAGYALVCLLCACESASPPSNALGSPDDSLDQAQSLLVAGDASGASIVLDQLDTAALDGATIQRYELLLATARHAAGDSWGAFQEIRDFSSRYFLSEYEPQIAELTFLIGSQLIQSDRTWWIFGSDQEDGELVLTDFISRFPTNSHVPQSLKLLGETAYQDRDYEMAQERFKDLRANHPRSEWAALASFRLAISAFKLLVGPEYDQTQMAQARSELQDYLSLDPERPEFRIEAEQALVTVTDWLSERELINANFYRRIGNRYGEVFHLRTLTEKFPQSSQAEVASQRLTTLGEGGAGSGPNR